MKTAHVVRILCHDDGRCADGTTLTPLDSNGKCPACGIHPDMQSLALLTRDQLAKERKDANNR